MDCNKYNKLSIGICKPCLSMYILYLNLSISWLIFLLEESFSPMFFTPLWNTQKYDEDLLRVFPYFSRPFAKWQKSLIITYFHYIRAEVTLVKGSIWSLQLLSFVILIFKIYLWRLNLFKSKQTCRTFLTLFIASFHYISVGVTLVKGSIWSLKLLSSSF